MSDRSVNKAQAFNFNWLRPLNGSFKAALSSLALFTFFGSLHRPLSPQSSGRDGVKLETLFSLCRSESSQTAQRLLLLLLLALLSLLDQQSYIQQKG